MMMPLACPMWSRVASAEVSCSLCRWARMAEAACAASTAPMVSASSGQDVGWKLKQVQGACGAVGRVQLERQPAEYSDLGDGGRIRGPPRLFPEVVSADHNVSQRRVQARSFLQKLLQLVEFVGYLIGARMRLELSACADEQNSCGVDGRDQVDGRRRDVQQDVVQRAGHRERSRELGHLHGKGVI